MKEQLMNELAEISQRITGFEKLEFEHQQVEEECLDKAAIAKVIETMADGVCVLSHDGKVLGVNAAFERLTGYAREELIGELPLRVHPKREREKIQVKLKECMERGPTKGMETSFLRKDSRELPVRLEFHTCPREQREQEFIQNLPYVIY